MFDTKDSMSEVRRFILAAGGALLFSLACLAAAMGPANAQDICKTPSTLDRPTLL